MAAQNLGHTLYSECSVAVDCVSSFIRFLWRSFESCKYPLSAREVQPGRTCRDVSRLPTYTKCYEGLDDAVLERVEELAPVEGLGVHGRLDLRPGVGEGAVGEEGVEEPSVRLVLFCKDLQPV